MAATTQPSGLVASLAIHAALLALLFIGFSSAPHFSDAPESIPVETITTTQLNEIMKGERDAKPAPAPPVLKTESEPTPPPPRPDPPPEPPKRPDPTPDPPPPEPPKRPEPTKPPPEPPKRPDPPKPEEKTEAPTPPQRPRPEKVEETPRPPERPRPVRTVEPKPAFKPDEIAKALSASDAKSEAKPTPDAKPKPAFDPNAIARMIGQTKTAELSPKVGQQGLPNHNAPHMSVSMERGLNEWLESSYHNCWRMPLTTPEGENYVFKVHVTFNPDGSLAGRATLLNPPQNAEWNAFAESAMQAVARCNPLHVPPEYAPYFEQWRAKTIFFDPKNGEG